MVYFWNFLVAVVVKSHLTTGTKIMEGTIVDEEGALYLR